MQPPTIRACLYCRPKRKVSPRPRRGTLDLPSRRRDDCACRAAPAQGAQTRRTRPDRPSHSAAPADALLAGPPADGRLGVPGTWPGTSPIAAEHFQRAGRNLAGANNIKMARSRLCLPSSRPRSRKSGFCPIQRCGAAGPSACRRRRRRRRLRRVAHTRSRREAREGRASSITSHSRVRSASRGRQEGLDPASAALESPSSLLFPLSSLAHVGPSGPLSHWRERIARYCWSGHRASPAQQSRKRCVGESGQQFLGADAPRAQTGRRSLPHVSRKAGTCLRPVHEQDSRDHFNFLPRVAAPASVVGRSPSGVARDFL